MEFGCGCEEDQEQGLFLLFSRFFSSSPPSGFSFPLFLNPSGVGGGRRSGDGAVGVEKKLRQREILLKSESQVRLLYLYDKISCVLC